MTTKDKWIEGFSEQLLGLRDIFLEFSKSQRLFNYAREVIGIYQSVYGRLLEKSIDQETKKYRETLLAEFLDNLDTIAVATANEPTSERNTLTSVLVYRLAVDSLNQRDYIYLSKTLWFYRRVYALALNNKHSEEVMKEIVKKTWLYIRDFCQYNLRLLIEQESNENPETIIALAELPLIELNYLAKSAVDASSYKAFVAFADTIRVAEIYSNPEEDDRLEGIWERKLAELRGIPYEGEVGQEAYIREALWRRRNTCFMGLGGWVIERCRDERITVDEANNMFPHLAIPFDDFLDVVFHPLDYPVKSRFGWMDWTWKWEEKEESPFNVSGTISGGPPWVNDYFILEALKNYQLNKPWENLKFKQPTAFGFQTRKQELERDIDRLKNEEVFKKLTGFDEGKLKEAVDTVKGYLTSIETRVTKQEKESIKLGEIDKNKYQLIKNNFSEGFKENAILRKILEANNTIKETPEELPQLAALRLNDLRSSYLEREDIAGLEHFWSEIGSERAMWESIFIIQKILDKSTPEVIGGAAEEVLTKVESVITEMNQSGLTPLVIFLLGWVFGWRSWQALENNPAFSKTPEGQGICPMQKGVFHSVPIIDIWWGKQNPLLLVLAPRSIQLKDKKLGEGYNQLFEFKFEDWAEEGKAEEVLQQYNGQYQDSKTGEKLTGEEAILEIQQHVFVRIFQSFDVKILDSKGVRFFEVKIEGEEKG